MLANCRTRLLMCLLMSREGAVWLIGKFSADSPMQLGRHAERNFYWFIISHLASMAPKYS